MKHSLRPKTKRRHDCRAQASSGGRDFPIRSPTSRTLPSTQGTVRTVAGRRGCTVACCDSICGTIYDCGAEPFKNTQSSLVRCSEAYRVLLPSASRRRGCRSSHRTVGGCASVRSQCTRPGQATLFTEMRFTHSSIGVPSFPAVVAQRSAAAVLARLQLRL